ncbi:MAG TPA: hypothetical protein VFA81_09730 [Burkholderiales bacterium]|nr:hypothetical protein [Burkholderiales bacterium]
MGSRHFRSKRARPILNERDYRAAKEFVEREAQRTHSEGMWERLDALAREIAHYEDRFLEGRSGEGDWIEYAYEDALNKKKPRRRRWSDHDDDE